MNIVTHTPGILILTRTGFESDACQELSFQLGKHSILFSDPVSRDETGWVFVPLALASMQQARKVILWQDLIFARQLLWIAASIAIPNDGDRVTPLIAGISEHTVSATGSNAFSSFLFETPDEDSAKELSGFCKSLSRPLESQLNKLKLLPKGKGAAHLPRLNLVMTDPHHVYVGFSDVTNSSPWPGGIPRLKFPPGAPSRSTLKLEEAFVTFMGQDKVKDMLRPGMTAVDLGASPGGWTFQLVKRGLHVTAVDNGPMDEQLMATGQVTHLREDAFTFRSHELVDILVCDVVEQPARITQLMLEWLREGRCKAAIFNLKLPMKKRWEETSACLDRLTKALKESGNSWQISGKQLFHDRKEVTIFIRES